MGALALPFRGKPQRRDQYMHGMIRVSRSAAAVAVLVGFGLLASLVLRIRRGDWLFLGGDWLFLCLCLLLLLLSNYHPYAEQFLFYDVNF